MAGHKSAQTETQTDRKMNGWMDRQMDKQIGGQSDFYTPQTLCGGYKNTPKLYAEGIQTDLEGHIYESDDFELGYNVLPSVHINLSTEVQKQTYIMLS